MNSEWPIVRLGEHCLKVGSGATPRGGASVYLDDGEVCLIRSQNVYNDGFKPEGLVYITEESASKLKNVIIESNDILLNITGDSVARVCLVHDKYLPARVNQHVAIIRPKPESFDARYLRYLLVSPAMQGLLLTIAAAGATRNALTKGTIEALEVPQPPLELQICIADKLGSLDNKIQLNRQTNQTLEKIAQAIFKSWFVDFEPTRAKIIAQDMGADTATQELAAQAIICGALTLEQLADIEHNLATNLQEAINTKLSHNSPTPINAEQLATTAALFPNVLVESELGEIPEGWRYLEASKVADIAIGKTPPRKEAHWFSKDNSDVRWVSIRDLGDSGLYVLNTSERLTEEAVSRFNVRRIPHNTVLLSFKMTVGRVAITNGEMLSNEAIAHFKLIEREHLSTEYLYLYLKCFNYDSLGSTSSIVTALNSKIIRQIPVLVPSAEISAAFKESIEPIFQGIKSLLLETQNLIKLRDTLLPKLLSGELDVSELADNLETEA